MSSDQPDDPLEMFRALKPSTRDTGELTPADEQLLSQILATPVERTPAGNAAPRSNRRRLAVATGVVVTAALATAAFTFLRSEPVTNPTAVVCYATADVINGDRVGLGSSDDPVEACSVVWRDGELGTDGSVPPLVGCVNAAGAAAVFPGEGNVCERLGLPNLEEDLSDEQVSIIQIQDDLVETFLEDCVGEDEAIAQAQRQLEAVGLDDWTARAAEPFPAELPCAAVGVLPDEKLVLVIGARDDD